MWAFLEVLLRRLPAVLAGRKIWRWCAVEVVIEPVFSLPLRDVIVLSIAAATAVVVFFENELVAACELGHY
jgi:hypothetical protein